MVELVWDIETNGLLDTVHTIWCISILDLATDKTYSYGPEEIEQALEHLLTADVSIGHNIIGYDLPVLKMLYDWEPRDETTIDDTLTISRLLNPDRQVTWGYKGKGRDHSLECWGYRAGDKKPDHSDWSCYSPEMLARNRADVRINAYTCKTLRHERGTHDWDRSIALEQSVQRIITQQEIRGCNFDLPLAHDLVEKLDGLITSVDDVLLPSLPRKCKPFGASVSKPFKNNGELLKRVVDWCGSNGIASDPISGPFTRIDWIQMNLGSMPQVKDYLLNHTGWQPTEWNTKDGKRTSPKLTEDSYDSIDGTTGKLIKDRFLYNHRKSQILGWITRVRDDGRITASANTCGTNTGRFRHSGVVNVPKADPDVFLGAEMRSLFRHSPGRRFVGHDASALEARMLAHYVDSPKLHKMILEGDIHEGNKKLMGLQTRGEAKTLYYALLYGSADDKLGAALGWTMEDFELWVATGEADRATNRLRKKKRTVITDEDVGNECRGYLMKRAYFDEIPEIEKLIKDVKKAAGKGWLRGLDGRKVWMRRNKQGAVMMHKALNTLLQSAGAVVMKESMVVLDSGLTAHNMDAWKVIDMHDESQADVLIEDVDKYVELAADSLVQSGIAFNLRIPLAADVDVGDNWRDTH